MEGSTEGSMEGTTPPWTGCGRMLREDSGNFPGIFRGRFREGSESRCGARATMEDLMLGPYNPDGDPFVEKTKKPPKKVKKAKKYVFEKE